MIAQMVSYAIIWINGLPVGRGLSSNLSHRTIMTGKNLEFNKHKKHVFGAYAKTHESMNPTN